MGEPRLPIHYFVIDSLVISNRVEHRRGSIFGHVGRNSTSFLSFFLKGAEGAELVLFIAIGQTKRASEI